MFELPVGVAIGLALGIGIDSLLNNWLNDVAQMDETSRNDV